MLAQQFIYFVIYYIINKSRANPFMILKFIVFFNVLSVLLGSRLLLTQFIFVFYLKTKPNLIDL